jgi:hypothetical protein
MVDSTLPMRGQAFAVPAQTRLVPAMIKGNEPSRKIARGATFDLRPQAALRSILVQPVKVLFPVLVADSPLLVRLSVVCPRNVNVMMQSLDYRR